MANEKKKTSIGGQALIEGIMMRGPFLTSMATRLPDGSIDVETWNTHKGGQKAHWTRRVPFLRGIFNMVDSMVRLPDEERRKGRRGGGAHQI